MTNKEYYRRAFSQVRPSRQVKWEDYHMKQIHSRRWGKLLAVAAILCLLAALSGVAVAVNFLGLRDLLLPQKQPVGVLDPDTGIMIPGKTWESDAVSLSGYMDSPESKALAEWEDFLAGYDPDGALLAQVGNYMDPAFDQYICYQVYTQEMADKLEEIVDKYDLKLHTQQIDLAAHPEVLGSLDDFAEDSNATYWTYMYEDGSCCFDGYACLEDWGLVDVQFQRAVKGWFNDVALNIGDAAEYQSWTCKTSSGVEVLLALGPGKSLIFADLPDCFAAFNVLLGTESEMTRERLEAVADRYDFSKLTPVVQPEIIPENVPLQPPAGERTTAYEAYATVLRNLLYGNVLPDGAFIDAGWSNGDLSANQFAVCDVDGDGGDELVLLFSTSYTAGMVGYVIDFDPTYTGIEDPITIRLTEFPDLTFYDNGVVKAGASHNQTWGQMWPYTLYVYDPESGFYDQLAMVYSTDRATMEEVGNGDLYPADVDKQNAGTVYYMSFPYSSGAERPGGYVWDQETYQTWLDGVLGDARELELTYLSLTEENIAAILDK